MNDVSSVVLCCCVVVTAALCLMSILFAAANFWSNKIRKGGLWLTLAVACLFWLPILTGWFFRLESRSNRQPDVPKTISKLAAHERGFFVLN